MLEVKKNRSVKNEEENWIQMITWNDVLYTKPMQKNFNSGKSIGSRVALIGWGPASQQPHPGIMGIDRKYAKF